MTGELDYSEIPSDMVREVREAAPHIESYIDVESSEFGGFSFDCTTAPWNDPRMRIALSRALDRRHVLRELGRGGKGQWLTGIAKVLPGQLGANASDFGDQFEGIDSGINFEHDPTEARKLMAAAGYPDGVAAIVHAADSSDPHRAALHAACVQSVRESGFRFSLSTLPNPQCSVSDLPRELATRWRVSMQREGSSHIGIGSLARQAADPVEIMQSVYGVDARGVDERLHPPIGQSEGFTDQRLIEMTRGSSEAYGRELVDQLNELQRYLATKMYIVPYVWFPRTTVYQPWIKQIPRLAKPVAEEIHQLSRPYYWFDEIEEWSTQSYERQVVSKVYNVDEFKGERTVRHWIGPPVWASRIYATLDDDVKELRVLIDGRWREYSPHSDLPGRRDFLVPRGARLSLWREVVKDE